MTTGEDDLLVQRLKRFHEQETLRAIDDLARSRVRAAGPSVRTSLPLMLLLGVVVLAVGVVAGVTLVGGDSGIGSTPVATASPTPIPTPTRKPSLRAEDVQGPFQLVFELPKDTWQADESIDGLATLSLVEGNGVDLGGSGTGLLAFQFTEVNGSRRVGPAWTSDCRRYRLDVEGPISSVIRKSGGFSAEQPDADFYRWFFADPLVHLPPGDWRITAMAAFAEGPGCSGQNHMMTATVLVHVTP